MVYAKRPRRRVTSAVTGDTSAAAGPGEAKARAAWEELNERQRYYLASVYDADEANEAGRASDAARGIYDRRPATEWRQLDAYHEPAVRELFGLTRLQADWEHRGYHNQGNGSTISALATRGMLIRDQYGTRFGVMHTVAITPWGRKVHRTGTGIPPARRNKLLGERAAHVLGQLYQARTTAPDGSLTWGYSHTIERMAERRPPLAEHHRGSYRITDAGATLYRRDYRAYRAAYPHLRLPDPSGAPDPWPRAADRLLAAHRAAAAQLKRARDELATHRDAAPVPNTHLDATLRGGHPVAAAAADAFADLATRHANEHAALATAELARVEDALRQEAARYAAATLAAVAALVAGADVAAAMTAAAEHADPATTLPAPAATRLEDVDARAAELHHACTIPAGPPVPRARPGRRSSRYGPPPPPPVVLDERGITAPLALAAYLDNQLHGGTLQRRLENAAAPEPERPARRPRGLLPEPALKLLAALATADEVHPHNVTRSARAPETLAERGYATCRDRTQGGYPVRTLTITEAGRAHLSEHRETYTLFHRNVLIPVLPDTGQDP